jgi:hypothetical protein
MLRTSPNQLHTIKLILLVLLVRQKSDATAVWDYIWWVMESGENVNSASGLATLGNRLRPGSKRVRSSVTNGSKAYVVGDGQSPWGRRQLDLIALHADDAGGMETLSEAMLRLCRRAAALETQLEVMEGQMSLGQEVDLDQYGRLAGHLRRILETLGVERKTRDASPTIEHYLNAKDAE